jgi:hypothetical protein
MDLAHALLARTGASQWLISVLAQKGLVGKSLKSLGQWPRLATPYSVMGIATFTTVAITTASAKLEA